MPSQIFEPDQKESKAVTVFFTGFGSSKKKTMRFAKKLTNTTSFKCNNKETFHAKKGSKVLVPWTPKFTGYASKETLDEITKEQYNLMKSYLLEAKEIRLQSHSFGNIKKDAFLAKITQLANNGDEDAKKIIGKITKIRDINPLYAFSTKCLGIILNFLHSICKLFTGNIFNKQPNAEDYKKEIALRPASELPQKFRHQIQYCEEDKIIKHDTSLMSSSFYTNATKTKLSTIDPKNAVLLKHSLHCDRPKDILRSI